MQNAAAHHAKMCGFGFDDLNLLKCFWVLSRVKVALKRFPEFDEHLHVTTWPVGVDKLFALRDFVFATNNGDEIGAATTSWLILDKHTFRPQRPDILNGLIYPTTTRPFASNAPKVADGDEKQLSHRQTAYYSDIDMNQHVNNAIYIDWMMNSLAPKELPTEHFTFSVNFNSQAVWGDTVEVWKRTITGTTIFLEIRKEGASVTSATLARHDTDACLFS